MNYYLKWMHKWLLQQISIHRTLSPLLIGLILLSCFNPALVGQTSSSSNVTAQAANAQPESWQEKVGAWDARYLDLEAQVSTLDTYTPENFSDFKDLEVANQLMEQLDFNRRKTELLIKQYNILEDELFPFLLTFATKHPQQALAISRKIKDYTDAGPLSINALQQKLNRVFLQVERLEKKLERLQAVSKNREIEKETKEKANVITQLLSTSAKIIHLENELVHLNSQKSDEEEKLGKLKEKEKKGLAKIDEISKEVTDYTEKRKKASNEVGRVIFPILSKVREIRLNGLEIPRLNAIKTFIYLSETNLKTLEKKILNTNEEVDSLSSQRQNELLWMIGKGLMIIFVAIFGVFIIMRIANRISKKVIARITGSTNLDSHHKQRYQTLSTVLMTFLRVLCWAMAVLWAFGELNIDYGPFLVAAGGVSLAIGFGAQSLVKDVVSGFFMLMEEQFALDDYVEISDISGTVEKISLRTVRVRSMDGTLHTIPNGSISKVSNKTYLWSRAVVTVGTSYNDDPKLVLDVLNKVAKEMSLTDEWSAKFMDEPIAQGIISFGESSINYRILAKTVTGSQWEVGREMMIRIKNAFDDAGIEIPYNYINVNLVDKTKEG